MATKAKTDEKAFKDGVLDGVLTIVFQAGGQLVAYAITLVPFLETFQNGKWSWVQYPLGVILGAIAKAIDRKIHEDSSARTGLIPVDV